MKKTLVALAALAAAGTSFAQVTISGNLTMGYQAVTTGGVGTSADAAGFGVDTSEIDFTATEDLGGGMKVTAKLALAGADRSGESNAVAAGSGNAVSGRDASLALTTGAGTLALASEQAPDYLSGGIAGVGAYYSGFNGKVFDARVNRDTVTYSVPVGALELAATYQEAAGLQGLGTGTTGAAATTGQSLAGLLATYSQGAVVANLTYLSFNSNVGRLKDQTRVSGSYDFGVAKLGLGAVVTNTNTAPAAGRATDLLLGVSVPMGALTLGAEFVQRKIDDVAFTTQGVGTISGSAVQASYALSKRTSLIGNYARWTQTVGNDASSQYQLLLSHSF
ncbi:MAG: porin [Rhodoferax sp.]